MNSIQESNLQDLMKVQEYKRVMAYMMMTGSVEGSLTIGCEKSAVLAQL